MRTIPLSRPKIAGSLVALVIAGLLPVYQAGAAEDGFLWAAPETNALGGGLSGGYAFGDQQQGPLLDARALFYFHYFVAGLRGEALFASDGIGYAMNVDLIGRLGPLHAGFTVGLHFLPGKGGEPSTAVGLEAGLTIPTGLDGLWLDLAYRPNLIFLEGSQLIYHGLSLGLIIEAGL